jgi:hypothetical protein
MELIDRISKFQTDIKSNYLVADTPVGASYEWYTDRVFGNTSGSGEPSAGTMADRKATINGSELTYDKVYDRLGYASYAEWIEKGNPIITDFVASLGEWRATTKDNDGLVQNVFIEAEPQLKKLTEKTQEAIKAISQGKTLAELSPMYAADGVTVSKYFYMVNDFETPRIVASSKKVENISELEGQPSMSLERYSKTIELPALYSNSLFLQLSGIDKTNK